MRTSATPALLSPSLTKRAVAMANLLGSRLVERADSLPFEGRGFGYNAGNVLLFHVLAASTTDERYGRAMASQLRRIVESNERPPAGLFNGISGVRAVLALLSREEPRYRRLVDRCDEYVESLLPELERAEVADINTFDLISGWAGMRLARCVTGRRDRDRLVDLLAWVMHDEARWCRVHPVRRDGPENDLGLAHGIPGVVAAVALTVDAPDDSLRALLSRQANRLVDVSVRRQNRVRWPYYLQAPAGEHARSAWCYGTPGVAAALLWSGQLLNDRALCDFAVEALEGEARVTPVDWEAGDQALCHGTLGNAVIFASAGYASGSATLLDGAARATELALETLESDDGRCWGLGPDLTRQDLQNELEGAAGIALALLTLSGDADSAWLRLHALAPFSPKTQ